MALPLTSTQRNPRPGKVVQTLRNKPLVSFFVLAYGLSWLLWIPVVISGLPVISLRTQAPSLYILPGIAVGVTGSAFLMTAVTRESRGPTAAATPDLVAPDLVAPDLVAPDPAMVRRGCALDSAQ